jgi:hypothetical protein
MGCTTYVQIFHVVNFQNFGDIKLEIGMGGGNGHRCVRNVYASVCYPRSEISLTVIFNVFLCRCENVSLPKYVPYVKGDR